MSIVARIESITPQMAEMYLQRNPSNRALRKRTVDRYADSMYAGRWRLNGEAIVIGDNGILLDGQHRLAAVVQSGTAIQSILVTGVDSSTFDTLDTGSVRTVADVLGISGAEKSNYLASGARALYIWRNSGSTSAIGMNWDSQTAGEFIRQNPDLKSAVDFVTSKKWKNMIQPGWLIALHVEFHRKDALFAHEFFEVLNTGFSRLENHPVRALRERLLEEASRGLGGSSSKKLTIRDRVALCIKAWNTLRAGEESGVLIFRSRGKRKEQMPVIK